MLGIKTPMNWCELFRGPEQPGRGSEMDTVTSDEETSRTERGAASVEYAVVVGAIAAVVIAVVIAMGDEVYGLFESLSESLGLL